MAMQTVLIAPSGEAFAPRIPARSTSLRILLLLCAPLFYAVSAFGQFQQPLVFSSAGAVMVRNDQTGVLTPTSGSPFLATGQTLTLDVNGRFLFGIASNSIDMYQITDSNSGAYSKVLNSPFASANTKQPSFIAVEPTGQYIAVVNQAGQNAGESSIETFAIDPVNLALVPVPGSFLELDSTVIGAGADLKNRHFYVFLGPNLSSPNQLLHSNSELNDYAIDPLTGFLSETSLLPGSVGRCFAMDPQGRFLVIGQGQNAGEVGIVPITASTGVLGPPAITSLAFSVFPIAVSTEVTGSFVYLVDSNGPPPTPVHIYAIDPLTQALTETASSPLPGFSSVPGLMGDPTGPFMYGLVGTSIQGYVTDSQTGYLVAVSGTLISAAGVDGSFTFSIPPGQQNLVGPVATLAPASLSLGSITVGTPSAAQTITLTSSGDQALSLSSIAITGANASEFAETNDCQAVLQPGKSCTISVIFTPSATGLQQATLTATDNAPGSPQPVQLSGSGVAPPPPQSAVTLMPGTLQFPTITEGTTSSSMTVTVTSSGTATLHISSVVLGGNNPSDFSMTSGCNGAYAVNSSCTISVTFTPLAAGQRTATITLTDDAPNSPQSIQLNGTGSTPPSNTPAVTLAPAVLSFGTITEGTMNGPQTISVTNSGSATLHVSSVALSGANSSDFSMTNGCNGAYAVNSNCSISVTFAPLAAGQRTATITLTDDAANSPQTINVSGNANLAITLGPAPNGSTSATVTAGQTAQYNLQMTPGTGYSGTVSFACSGAPLGAVCPAPASLSAANGATVSFTVTVSTSGSASLPTSHPKRLIPLSGLRLLPLLALAIFLINAFKSGWNLRNTPHAMPFVSSAALAAIFFFLMIHAVGCGGGSASVTTAPIVTPAGTSTITLTPSAMSSSGKPLQLQSIQLTLTVN